MQRTNSPSMQNVVGRITHGLIGLDIYLNEKKGNDYLKDFLTLEEEEIKCALVATSSTTSLIPPVEGDLSEQMKELLECVARTQQLVSNLDKANSEEKIMDTIHELGAKLDVLYQVIRSE